MGSQMLCRAGRTTSTPASQYLRGNRALLAHTLAPEPWRLAEDHDNIVIGFLGALAVLGCTVSTKAAGIRRLLRDVVHLAAGGAGFYPFSDSVTVFNLDGIAGIPRPTLVAVPFEEHKVAHGGGIPQSGQLGKKLSVVLVGFWSSEFFSALLGHDAESGGWQT